MSNIRSHTASTTRPVDFAGERRAFMYGNEVVVRAALAAKAGFLFGYPITPQNEIMHYWSRQAPAQGGNFYKQRMSFGWICNAGRDYGRGSFVFGNRRPRTVLFQEPLSMAEMMRIPIVLIVQQRGGPSTATVIYSQQEVFWRF